MDILCDDPHLDDAGKMVGFRDRDEPRVANAERAAFSLQSGGWVYTSSGFEGAAQVAVLGARPAL